MSEVEQAATATPSESSSPVPSGSPTEPTTNTPPTGDSKDSNGYTVPPSASEGQVDDVYAALSKTYDEITGETKAEPEQSEPPAPAQAEEPEPDTSQEVETAPETEASDPEQQGHAEPVIEAPQAWSADAKAEWASLPPKAQEYIAQREAEAHQKISQQGEQIAQFAPLIERFQASPYAHMDMAQQFNGLLNAQYALDTNAPEALKALAQHYNVDLSTLVQKPEGAESNEFDDLFHDPRVDTLQGELNELKQQNQALLQQQQAYWQQQQQQALEAQSKEAEAVLSKARADMPGFTDLEAEIANEVKALKVLNPNMPVKDIVDQAYQRAYALSPKVQEKQKAEAEAKAKADAAKKLAKAKAQQSANVKSSEKVQRTHDKAWDDHDALSEIFDAAQSR